LFEVNFSKNSTKTVRLFALNFYEVIVDEDENNTSRNNWKLLFEVNSSKNSTKTVRLFALDFYEVIVDKDEGLINYHLIEIWSS